MKKSGSERLSAQRPLGWEPREAGMTGACRESGPQPPRGWRLFSRPQDRTGNWGRGVSGPEASRKQERTKSFWEGDPTNPRDLHHCSLGPVGEELSNILELGGKNSTSFGGSENCY